MNQLKEVQKFEQNIDIILKFSFWNVYKYVLIRDIYTYIYIYKTSRNKMHNILDEEYTGWN